MIRPKLPLNAGSLGRFGRFLGMIVDGERKMAINEANFVGVGVYQTRKQRCKRCATRSLKVAILNNSH